MAVRHRRGKVVVIHPLELGDVVRRHLHIVHPRDLPRLHEVAEADLVITGRELDLSAVGVDLAVELGVEAVGGGLAPLGCLRKLREEDPDVHQAVGLHR